MEHLSLSPISLQTDSSQVYLTKSGVQGGLGAPGSSRDLLKGGKLRIKI